jgi:hypothetical protein
MGIGIKLLGTFCKKRAARTVALKVAPSVQGEIKFRKGARDSIVLRGRYMDYRIQVSFCLVWGSCWLTLKALEEINSDIDIYLSRDNQGRKVYNKKREDLDEWDRERDLDTGDRQYLSDHVYWYGDKEEVARARLLFEKLPAELQKELIAAVEHDSHGRFRLFRNTIDLGVAARIFWSRKPAQMIRSRIELAAATMAKIEEIMAAQSRRE